MGAQNQDTITFACPACQTTLTVPSYLAGIKGPCPRCQHEISAPNPAEQLQGASVPMGVAPSAAEVPTGNGAVAALQNGFPPMPTSEPAAPVSTAPAPVPVAPEAAPRAMPVSENPFPTAPVQMAPAAAPSPLPIEPRGMPAPAVQTEPIPSAPANPPLSQESAVAQPASLPWPTQTPPSNGQPQPPADPGVVSGEAIAPFANPLAGGGMAAAAPSGGSQRSRSGKKGIHPSLYLIVGLLAVGGALVAAFMFWPKDDDGGAGGTVVAPTPALPVASPKQAIPGPDPANTPQTGVPKGDPPPPPNAVANGGTNNQGGSSTPGNPQGGPPPIEEPAPPTPGITSKGAEGAREALDAFLAASSVEERLKFVQTPSRVSAEMNRYYTRQPLEVQPTELEFKLSGEVPGGDSEFHVFQMKTAAQPEGFPVSVEETSSGPKVDWMAFVQFHDNRLGKFIKIPQLEEDTFYAIVERRHYFRTDVPDLGSKLCVGIQPPIPGYEGYAFVEKDSPLAATLDEKFQWEHMYFPVLTLQWKRTQDGGQYIEVKEIVRDSWRADG